jgi:hypothetical protein
MGFFERIDRHSDLFHRMAAVTDIDLRDAMIDGRLNAHQLPSAIWRCTACTEAEACARWLEDHAEGSRVTPGYCRNRDLLAQLRR